MQKSLAKSCFWHLLWRKFLRPPDFLILPRFYLESKLQRKMSAEEQQRLDDFEKRLDGLKRDLGQLKLALGNSNRRFNELENRFGDLKQ